MTNLEAIRNQVNAAKEAAKAQLAEKIEMAKLQTELSLLNNEKFQQARIAAVLRQEATDKLEELNNVCATIVDSNQVYSQAQKQVRTWKPSKRYGFGNQFAELIGLLNGIQYSVSEHSNLMLAATGLNKDLIETTLSALGTNTYYSVNNSVIVQGQPVQLEDLINGIQLIEQCLGVSIDKSKLTQEQFDLQERIATAKAEQAEAEMALTLQVQSQVIR